MKCGPRVALGRAHTCPCRGFFLGVGRSAVYCESLITTFQHGSSGRASTRGHRCRVQVRVHEIMLGIQLPRWQVIDREDIEDHASSGGAQGFPAHHKLRSPTGPVPDPSGRLVLHVVVVVGIIRRLPGFLPRLVGVDVRSHSPGQ